jgi:hypothetical protein
VAFHGHHDSGLDRYELPELHLASPEPVKDNTSSPHVATVYEVNDKIRIAIKRDTEESIK